MPYIRKDLRAKLERSESNRCDYAPGTPGELNYRVTKDIQDYIKNCGGPSYSVLNDVVGVLECAKLELYRRVVAPYEDKKIEENGDVYDCEYKGLKLPSGTSPNPNDFMDGDIYKIIQAKKIWVAEHTEEIIEAFMAKYNCQPEDLVIKQKPSPGGGFAQWVEKKQ